MSEPPTPDGGAARSDSASRLAALLADVVERPEATEDPDAPPRSTRRIVRRRPPGAAAPNTADDPDRTADLADLLSGGPATPKPATADDAAGSSSEDAGEPTAPIPVLAKAAPTPKAAPAPSPRAEDERPGADWVAANAEASRRARDDQAARAARRAPRLTLRAVAFGIAFALLVAAVPALGWVGKERLLESQGGVFVDGTSNPLEPGYRAAVEPTATALVVHRDAANRPVSASVLSLGPVDGGGTVLLIPLTLEPKDNSYFSTILGGYDATENDDGFRRSIEDVLKVSIPPPLINVTDENLDTLIAPVAPLELDVVDSVALEDGTPMAGEVQLPAADVGPFLRATRGDDEPEIARLERSADVWMAWLQAIQDATQTEPIGATSTGIGSFLRELAKGPFVVETLDVIPGEPAYYGQPPSQVPVVPGEGMNEQVIDAIPQPRSPREGTRFDIELVNGAEGGTLPMGLMHDLTLAGGSLAYLVNAETFGQQGSTVAYADEEWRDAAELVAAMLNDADGDGEPDGDPVTVEPLPDRRAEAETEDLVITIGADVLERYRAEEEGSGG